MPKTERVSTEPRWFSLNLTRVHVSNPGPHRGAKAVPSADALRAHGLETLGPPGTMPDPPASTQSR
jgi:hypothetical protein